MTYIAAVAGVTKRTLYHHFDSKDTLLEAMLEKQGDLSAGTLARSVDRPAASAPELVAGIFDDLHRWADQDG
jgi:AcrR family transcriptional regulator